MARDPAGRVRTVRPVCLLVVVLACSAPSTPALAEGPGYGGTADELAMRWVRVQTLALASSTGDAEVLRVEGVGFRARGAVSVRVGSAQETTAFADDTGTLVLELRAGAGRLEPGSAGIAIGETPGGSVRTLLGTVPPRSDASNRVGTALQAVLLGLAMWAGAAWRKRRVGARVARNPR